MLQQPPDVAQLMQALQLQQQQIAQLQQFAAAQQVQPAAAAPPSHRVERPKLPSPPSFDGKGASLDEGESAIRKQLNWYRTPASDELAVAEAFLTGAAYDWWKHLLLASKAAVIDFASLVAALRARFQPVTTAELARLQLSKLAQGKAAVHDYISAFRRLLTPLTSMAEEDRLFAFMRGLRSDIATQLRVHGVKSLELAIEMAARVGTMGEYSSAMAAGPSAHRGNDDASPMDVDAMMLAGIEGLEQESTSSSLATGSSSSAPITHSQFAQLLAVMQERRGGQGRPRQKFDDGRYRHNKLSREEMDAHFAAGTCFECGKAGHQARNCPKKKASGQPPK